MLSEENLNRRDKIYSKGFNMYAGAVFDDFYDPTYLYSKVKVGMKVIENGNVIISPRDSHIGGVSSFLDKAYIVEQIKNRNIDTLTEISKYYYEVSGIYSRLCRYMAYLYRYDWKVTPYINAPELVVDDGDAALEKNVKINKKIIKKFNNVLFCLDNLNIKKLLGEIALKVIVRGVYYGYIVRDASKTKVSI
jgi:hypothetical protein